MLKAESIISAMSRLFPKLLGIAPLFFILFSFDPFTPGNFRSLSRFGFCETFFYPLFEDLKAAQLIEMLAPLGAANDGNPGRPVNEPNGALCFVLVLPALAAGHERLDVAGGEDVVACSTVHTSRKYHIRSARDAVVEMLPA